MSLYSLRSSQRKSLAKCVDVKRVRDWVPEKLRKNIDLTNAWSIITKHYCAALVTRGVCPIECDNCKSAIISMFRLEEARNSEALLTWMAKDVSAAEIERLILAQKAEAFPAQETKKQSAYDDLFRKKKPEPENIFAELMKDYE